MDAALDAALRQDFLVEAGELIERLGEQLVQLEAAPRDGELLNAVFRAFHTVKGGAGFLAINPMVQLCHHAEDLLNEARRGALVLDANQMDALLEALDLLQAMMASVACGAAPMPPSATLLHRLMLAAPAPAAMTETFATTAIDDDDFEALLDRLYGDAAPGTTPKTAELDPLSDAPAFPAPSLGPNDSSRDAAQEQATPRAATAETSVRIDTAHVDALVNRAGELLLLRNRLRTLAGQSHSEPLTRITSELDRVADDVQGAALGMRMQPVSRLFQRFVRIVRDLARQLGKEVDLVLEGEGTDLDRSLVESLADPLIHLLRNALDHGVELPAQRQLCGKPRRGRITLAASQRGERIVITVSDDGHGMNPDVLRRKAVQKGLLDAAQAEQLSDAECHELIFHPGFSTADAVSDISGRGVGMDVVKTRVAELGGTLSVHSTPGQGSTLELAVPLTLAVQTVLMVCVGAQRLALPMANVDEVFELAVDKNGRLDGHTPITHRGRSLPLYDLAAWASAPGPAPRHVAVLHIGHQRVGALVHEVLGRENVMVKPLGPLFNAVPGVAGATVTGSGELALVLDPAGLVQLMVTTDNARMIA